MSTWYAALGPDPPGQLDDCYPRGADSADAWEDGWALYDLARQIEREDDEAKIAELEARARAEAADRLLRRLLDVRQPQQEDPPDATQA